METFEVVVRPYQPIKDDAYIYSTWTKYAYYSPKVKVLEKKQKWFENKIKEIKDILSKGIIHVACLKGTPNMIMGYIAVMDKKVVWMCVKKNYHKQGIENILIKSMKGNLDEERKS